VYVPTLKCGPVTGSITSAARLSQSDRLERFGTSDCADGVSRSTDDAPPLQLGPVGRARATGALFLKRFSGMATTSFVCSARSMLEAVVQVLWFS